LLGPLICLAVLSWGTLVAAQHHHHQAQPPNSSEAKVEFRDNREARILTLRLGPITLAPRTEHMNPPVPLISVPFDAWYIGYEPRVVSDDREPGPRHVLHHVELLNIDRRNFICPRQAERMFAAGSELSDWPQLPGVGYRVAKGQRIAVAAMLHNATDQQVSNAYLELRIRYALPDAARLTNMYPAWFLVSHCGPTIYDLPPGRNVKSSELTVGYSGKLLGIGGHIHDHGRQLRLNNVTRGEHIGTLNTDVDADGRLRSIPVVVFPEGYRINAGEAVKVTAVYENSTGRALPNAAMGIVVGYFLPDDDRELAALTRDPASEWKR
jgi:hypothetical protein